MHSFGHFIVIYCPPGAQVRHLATNTHSANCKWRRINIVSPPRNSIKRITCSHRNNLTLDGAHSRDPCNIPAERKGDRVKGLRDMRDTDRQIYRQTDLQTDRDLRN